MVAYEIKKPHGEHKFKGIKNIPVSNQFGELIVDVKKAKLLLVPSAKDHYTVPEELDPITINHFKCYKAKVSKDTPKFEPREVKLSDQFGDVAMKVTKPKQLCSPVDKNEEGIVNHENYLMCYDLKKIKGDQNSKRLKYLPIINLDLKN